MPAKFYLDEDVDPLLAQVLRERGVDCVSTQEAGNHGSSDTHQLAFAIGQDRALLTFNVKDFVLLAQDYAQSDKHHSGIVVSNHLPFRELLRRTLFLIKAHSDDNFQDKLLWLQDYKNPKSS